MKIAGVLTVIASGILAAYATVTVNTARPPITPDPIETPTPEPTPEPTPKTGTIGMNLPVIYPEWWLLPTDKYAIISALREDFDYRTNIMFNWEGNFIFDLVFYAADGTQLGNVNFETYKLENCSSDPCSGYYQLNNALYVVNSTYKGLYTIKIIPMNSSSGKFFCFATMIDNKSNDPTLLTQFRFTSNDQVWNESGLYAYK